MTLKSPQKTLECEYSQIQIPTDSICNLNMKSHSATGRDSFKPNKTRRRTYLPGNTALPSTYIMFMKKEEGSVLRLKARRSAKLSGVLVLSVMCLMIFDNETDYRSLPNGYSGLLRVLIIVLNIVQMALIYKYYKTKLEEKKARMDVCLNSHLFDDPEIRKKFLLEISLSLICVPPFVDFDIVLPDFLMLSFADVILVLSFGKCYLLVKLLYEYSSRNTERTKFYSRRFNLGKGWRFILKSYATDYPVLSVITLSLLLFFVFSFIMRIFERPSISIWDSFWLIGVTETSLGYGDIVPGNLLGRSISFLSAIFGLFLHSFSLMFLKKRLELSIEQEKFYENVKFAKKDLKEEATLFIQAWWRYIRNSTKNAPRLGFLRRYASNFRKFSKKRKVALLEKQNSLKSELIKTSASILRVFELSHNKLSNTQELVSKSDIIVRESYSILERIDRIRDVSTQVCPTHMESSRKELEKCRTQRHSSERVEMKIKRDMALVKHVSKNSYTSRDITSLFASDKSSFNTEQRRYYERYSRFSNDSQYI